MTYHGRINSEEVNEFHEKIRKESGALGVITVVFGSDQTNWFYQYNSDEVTEQQFYRFAVAGLEETVEHLEKKVKK